MWKVYRIETDEILKAGFASEDEAKEWFDRHNFDEDDNIGVDEMDSDEEEQWLEGNESEEYAPEEKESVDEEDDAGDIEGLNFRSGATDLDDDDFYDDDEDFEDDDEESEDYNQDKEEDEEE